MGDSCPRGPSIRVVSDCTSYTGFSRIRSGSTSALSFSGTGEDYRKACAHGQVQTLGRCAETVLRPRQVGQGLDDCICTGAPLAAALLFSGYYRYSGKACSLVAGPISQFEFHGVGDSCPRGPSIRVVSDCTSYTGFSRIRSGSTSALSFSGTGEDYRKACAHGQVQTLGRCAETVLRPRQVGQGLDDCICTGAPLAAALLFSGYYRYSGKACSLVAGPISQFEFHGVGDSCPRGPSIRVVSDCTSYTGFSRIRSGSTSALSFSGTGEDYRKACAHGQVQTLGRCAETVLRPRQVGQGLDDCICTGAPLAAALLFSGYYRYSGKACSLW